MEKLDRAIKPKLKVGEGGVRYGEAIANVGDVNQDGFEDFAVGAPYQDDGAGVVYIYFGRTNRLLDKGNY